MMMRISITSTILLWASMMWAQSYQLSPLTENSRLKIASPRKKLAPQGLSLPFIDDFSYAGPYPDPLRWQDDKVFVNQTMAYQPPSVGVATFDALNRNGKPYGNAGEVGSADTLTCVPLNLSGLRVADSVMLSFYVQAKGLCYAPNLGDSLVLEFRLRTGEWLSMAQYDGIESNRLDTFPPFAYKNILLRDERFFYDGFQFRFRNYGRLNGMYEIWHLDYVHLGKNRRSTPAYDDIAFTQLPPPILKNYTALPWRHFKSDINREVADSFRISLFSHFLNVVPITDSRVGVREVTTNVALFPPYAFITGNFNPNQNYELKQGIIPANNMRTALGQAFTNQDSLVFETEYSLINTQQATGTARNNDWVRRRTICSNEFAYDDGTAEMQFSATGVGTQTAIRFRANVADTLRAVRIAFPHINGDATQFQFHLKVWIGHLNTAPVYIKLNLKPIYPDNFRDTLQAFTTYQLTDAAGNAVGVPIPVGDFYIGWQNVGDVRIPIGLDRNNLNATGYISQFLNGSWSAVNQSWGAVMIRPVVGKYAPQGSNTLSSEEIAKMVKIAPNPAANYLRFEFVDAMPENFKIECFDMSGKLLKILYIYNQQADVSDLPIGMYVLRITDEKQNKIFKHKFVIFR